MRGLLTKLFIGLIACGLPLSALGVFAASPTRQALWQVVRACVADFKLTGGSFPCRLVDLTGGEEQGYVVLRAPFGPPDLVLVPTRRVIGVEDPWLQSPNSPNYFDAAWRSRPYLKGPDGRSPHPDEFALAVNSALTRSQDQLHIHLGCFLPAPRVLLACDEESIVNPCFRTADWSLDARPRSHSRFRALGPADRPARSRRRRALSSGCRGARRQDPRSSAAHDLCDWGPRGR